MQCDDVVISDMNDNLQGLKIYLCAKFGCLTPECVEVFEGNNQTNIYYSKVVPKKTAGCF